MLSPPAIVVMEATGTYWLPLVFYLQGEGFAVSVVYPLQAHHYAKSLLLKAKND